MPPGVWLAPGPLRASSQLHLEAWLSGLVQSVGLVAIGTVEIDGDIVDPFAIAAGLGARPGLPALGVSATLDGRRLPTVIGRELIALDHVSGGRTGLVLDGATPTLDESGRILEAMLGGAEVVGRASSAMPADFAFRNRPGPATRGGPMVVLVDPVTGARTLAGEQVSVVALADDQLLDGQMPAPGHQGRVLAVRHAASGADPALLHL